MYSCKIDLENSKIRTKISTYQDLLDEITKIDEHNSLIIFYFDEDKDWVELNSKNHFEECLKFYDKSKGFIKIKLVKKNHPFSSSTTHPSSSAFQPTLQSLPFPPSNANPNETDQLSEVDRSPQAGSQVKLEPLSRPLNPSSRLENNEDNEQEEEEYIQIRLLNPIDDDLNPLDPQIKEEEQKEAIPSLSLSVELSREKDHEDGEIGYSHTTGDDGGDEIELLPPPPIEVEEDNDRNLTEIIRKKRPNWTHDLFPSEKDPKGEFFCADCQTGSVKYKCEGCGRNCWKWCDGKKCEKPGYYCRTNHFPCVGKKKTKRPQLSKDDFPSQNVGFYYCGDCKVSRMKYECLCGRTCWSWCENCKKYDSGRGKCWACKKRKQIPEKIKAFRERERKYRPKWTFDLFPTEKDEIGDFYCADCKCGSERQKCEECGRNCWKWCEKCRRYYCSVHFPCDGKGEWIPANDLINDTKVNEKPKNRPKRNRKKTTEWTSNSIPNEKGEEFYCIGCNKFRNEEKCCTRKCLKWCEGKKCKSSGGYYGNQHKCFKKKKNRRFWKREEFPTEKIGEYFCADCKKSPKGSICECSRTCWKWCERCEEYRSCGHKKCRTKKRKRKREENESNQEKEERVEPLKKKMKIE